MTTKDYKRIASILRSYQDEMNPLLHSALVNSFATGLLWDNPRFDAVKFREACRK